MESGCHDNRVYQNPTKWNFVLIYQTDRRLSAQTAKKKKNHIIWTGRKRKSNGLTCRINMLNTFLKLDYLKNSESNYETNLQISKTFM